MRERILMNRDWRFLADPGADPVPKTQSAMYLSSKTERLKWGPGGWRHNDTPGFWNLYGELHNEPWEKIDLPHDYLIDQTPDVRENSALGFFRYYPAWYRKHFTLNENDRSRRLVLFFEGVTGIAEVYLNGCFLIRNNGGYNSFEVDITDIARFDDENVLAVYVNPNSYETWWYAGGGIYRNVWLEKSDPVAIERWGAFIPVRQTGVAE